MNVKQLREALAGFPDDLEVQTEGCDCWGRIGSVDLDELSGDNFTSVLLQRPLEGSDRQRVQGGARDAG